MESGLGDEEDSALSDFEDDELEAAPLELPAGPPPAPARTPVTTAQAPAPTAQSSSSSPVVESLKAVLADLEEERQARIAAEAAKAEADNAGVKYKSYIHEVIRQRDEALKQKDEALRAKEERAKQLEEALQSKEDVSRQKDEIIAQRDEIQRQRDESQRQRDEIQKQRDDLSRARDSSKAEISSVAQILVTQAEKVMAMTNGVKSFSGGLPRVSKASGLTAIALGFTKRVEEVVEEVFKQRGEALRRRDELHSQMEQRNFSIAIEVSQLEASITQLKDEVGKKASELEKKSSEVEKKSNALEKWQKSAAGKDEKIANIEREMLEQLDKTKQEAEVLKQRVEEVEGELEVVNSETAQNMECAGKVKTQLLDILGLMHSENLFGVFQSDWVENPQADDEPQQKGFLAEAQEIMDLASRVSQLWKENQQKAERERKDFESTVKMLHAEKGDILLKLSFADDHQTASSEGSEMESVDKTDDDRTEGGTLTDGKVSSHQNGLDNAGGKNSERYQIIGEGPQQMSLKLLQAELAAHENRKEQTSVKIALLEQDVENLQKELRRTISSARQEIDRLQHHVAAQGRDIAAKSSRILELEKHVDSLTRELTAAEEEIGRWKEAATAEAAAGARMVEEVELRNTEIAGLNDQSTKYRELVEEANMKVGTKEDMASAAMNAVNAAERSRQLADERAAELRYRLEEVGRQLEELEQRSQYRMCGMFDWCLPWLQGRGRRGHGVELSAEMEELLDPLV